jgi:hypothetical protein
MTFSRTRPKVHKSSFESFVRMNDGTGAGSRQERRRGPGIERALGARRCSAPSSESVPAGWPLASEQPPMERSNRADSQSIERSSRAAGTAGSNLRAQQRPTHQCTSPGSSAVLLHASRACHELAEPMSAAELSAQGGISCSPDPDDGTTHR